MTLRIRQLSCLHKIDADALENSALRAQVTQVEESMSLDFVVILISAVTSYTSIFLVKRRVKRGVR